MQQIRYFCDSCGAECFVKDGLGTFAGFLVKISDKLEPQRVGFEGHYCSVCTEKILKFFSQENAQDSDPPGVG